MKFLSRRLVKHEDLNPADRLFGGRLLEWIDEEAAIFASCQLSNKRIVTKYMSEINFVSTGKLGDVVEFGFQLTKVGTTSITIRCSVQNKETKLAIISIEKMTFVCVDEEGQPQAHGLDISQVA